MDAGEGPTHVVTDARGRFLVADTRGDAVRIFAAHPWRSSRPARCPAPPTDWRTTRRRRRLWVTLTALNQVVRLSTAGAALAETARYPTVRQPNTVAVDPRTGRVFVGSRTTGKLQLIDP